MKKMANEKRLIDANDAWQKTFNCDEVAEVRKLIEDAPTVDAVEVVHGRWKFACVHNGKPHYKCTNCHHAFPFANVNYCPNCGAKMDGDKHE